MAFEAQPPERDTDSDPSVAANVLLSRDVPIADAAYRPIPDFEAWDSGTAIDERTWSQYVETLQTHRAAASPEALTRAAAVATRTAAIETGAIEGLYQTDRGFTFTVATEAAAWDATVMEHGADVRGHFDAQLAAYELVLDAATRSAPVTQALIRGLHELVCRNQETYVAQTPNGPQEQVLRRGEYKRQPNHVRQVDGSIHSYAPVLDTEPEMARLVGQLATAGFLRAHAIKKASYAHYCLAAIHPFVDGNGRVARALASVYLYEAISMPFVVFSDQVQAYFEALALADEGHFQPLSDFVFERTLDAINLLAEQLRAAAATPLPDRLQSFRELLRSSGGLLHQELDAVASRLLGLAAAAVQTRLAELDLPPGVHIGSGTSTDNTAPVTDGYRRVIRGDHTVMLLMFVSDEPAGARIEARFDVTIATAKETRDTLQLRIFGRGDDLPVPLHDIHPSETDVLRIRLRVWAESILAEKLAELETLAASSLSAKGY